MSTKTTIALGVSVLALIAAVFYVVRDAAQPMASVDTTASHAQNGESLRSLEQASSSGHKSTRFAVKGTATPESLKRTPALAAATLRGRVIDEDGKAVAKATVLAIAPHEDSNPVSDQRDSKRLEHRTTSDVNGRFSITGIERGSGWSLEVLSDDHLKEILADLELVHQEPLEVEVVLRRGSVISGRVIDGDGNPLGGARVQASPGVLRINSSKGAMSLDFLGSSLGKWEKATRTDAQGQFLLRGIPAGNAQLLASHANWAPAHEDSVAAGTTSIELQLAAPGRIAGWVVDELGEPIASASILLHGTERSQQVVTDRKGSSSSGVSELASFRSW